MPMLWHDELKHDLETTTLTISQLAKKYDRSFNTIKRLQDRMGVIRKPNKSGNVSIEDLPDLGPPFRALGIRITIHRGTVPKREYADFLGVSPVVLQRMELGRHDYLLTQLLRILQVLGLSIEEALSPHTVATYIRR